MSNKPTKPVNVNNTKVEVDVVDTATKDTPTVKKKVVVFTTARLNVRKEPTKESEVVRVLENDVPVEVESEDASWYRTNDGFVMKKFTKSK